MKGSSALKNLEDFFSSFIDFPDPVVVIDDLQRAAFVNRAAREFLGCAGEPPAGGRSHYSEILRTDREDGIGSLIERCLRGESVDRLLVRLRNPEGKEISAFVTGAPIRGSEGKPEGCIAIFRDIEADLAVQPEIQRKLATLSGILDNFPVPVFTVDSNLIVTYMNDHMADLTGYAYGEVVNRLTCADLLHTLQCGTEDCLLRQAMEHRSPIPFVRRTVTSRDGRDIPVIVTASIITDSQGRVIGGFEAVRDITSIVEAEQKIALLTEMTREGILMLDDSYRIIFANSRMGDITGLSKERLIGLDFGDILPSQHRDIIFELVRKADRENQQHLHFCSTIKQAVLSSGNHRSFEVHVAVSRAEKGSIIYLYFRDLTQRIEIENELRKANSFLNNIINSSVYGIIVVDTSGNVLIFNEGAERILDYRAEEVIGHREVFRHILDPKIARENKRLMRSAEHGPPGKLNTVSISLRRKDGEEVPVLFSAAIIREGGNELGSVGMFSDQREHFRIRRELEQARIQLLQSERIASLGRLAAGVAHEINNPLAGILIYADMLMREVKSNPQWAEDLDQIITQTLRCKEIVTRLLEFSRQPLGQRVSFNPNEIVNRCVALLCHQTLFHDVKFTLDLQSDLPDIVGDPGQIQQVCTNLLINAANAMNGKGQLAVTTRFDRQSDYVMMDFADTGPGIPPEIHDKIFEPFFTTKAPGEGTGLGLSVVYGIIQQHGGDIIAENSPGGGAVFTVSLPLVSPEDLIETAIED